MELYPHQLSNAHHLFASVRSRGSAIDCSDTGTGKSFTALTVAAATGRKPFIVCPLSVGPGWEAKAAACEVDLAGWTNYEKARRPGWVPPSGSFVIFDEVHRCKSPSSQQAQLLVRVARDFQTLLLSATPFSTPLDTRAILSALRATSWSEWYRLLPKLGCYRDRRLNNAWQWRGSVSNLEEIRRMIGNGMVKTRWQDVTGFPDILVQPEAAPVANKKAVDELLRIIATSGKLDITKALQARMLVESAKVNAMTDMALDAEAQGNSVVAFFNFTEPLHTYAATLGNCAVLDGSTSSADRARIVAEFQSSRTPRFLACNIRAGGVGIDLHDTVGVPRVALHCPTWSAQDFKQALGRIHRAGSLSRAVQKIIFAAGTLDVRVLAAVQSKLNNIETLTDSDLNP